MVKLEDYTITELKKMISSFNKLVGDPAFRKFKAYSKKKKAELITMIRTHPKIKVEEGVNAVKLSISTDEKEKVKQEVKKEVEKLDDVVVDNIKMEIEETHKMPDGSIMSGKSHEEHEKKKQRSKKPPTEKQLAARKKFSDMQKAKKRDKNLK